MLAACGRGAKLGRVMADGGEEATPRGHSAADEAAAASWEEQTPGGTNPTGVSGVKQTRKATGGANPRGGEKPRGGNVPGEANPGQVDSRS